MKSMPLRILLTLSLAGTLAAIIKPLPHRFNSPALIFLSPAEAAIILNAPSVENNTEAPRIYRQFLNAIGRHRFSEADRILKGNLQITGFAVNRLILFYYLNNLKAAAEGVDNLNSVMSERQQAALIRYLAYRKQTGLVGFYAAVSDNPHLVNYGRFEALLERQMSTADLMKSWQLTGRGNYFYESALRRLAANKKRAQQTAEKIEPKGIRLVPVRKPTP